MLFLCDDRPRAVASFPREEPEKEVVRRAREQLETHVHFRCHTRTILIRCREGKLLLSGRVPTFHLKQVLQSALRDLPGVSKIVNQVDVVSSNSLSSVRGQTIEEEELE